MYWEALSEFAFQTIQGFGPPMDKQPDESLGMGKPEEKKEENNQPEPNIPKPKKFVPDPNSPIYKQGDKSQAGELGKAVNVDKGVSSNIYLVLYSKVASGVIQICSSLERDLYASVI